MTWQQVAKMLGDIRGADYTCATMDLVIESFSAWFRMNDPSFDGAAFYAECMQ